jgi:putative restriction endonuclease
VRYSYQDGPLDNHFNTWLRQAHQLQVPLVYFVGTRPNWYRPEYPAWVVEDDPGTRRVLVRFGKMRGPYDEREPVLIEDEIERRYVVRQVRQRIHQTRFRGAVIPAYSDRCAICRLKEVRLLDAAHIVPDADERGEPVVSNGLSLCTIHHRAYDQDLIGVSSDYTVHVARQLLDEKDGPMLDLLKGSHGATIDAPTRRSFQPDRERLGLRFERFRRPNERRERREIGRTIRPRRSAEDQRSSARDGSNDCEGLGPLHDGVREMGIRRVVRQVLAASEVAHVGAPLPSRLVPDRSSKRRVRGLKRVKYVRDRRRPWHLDADLGSDGREGPQVGREHDSNRGHGIVCTSTESTAGRCSTIGAHVSPESDDAKTCPPVVPT